MASGWWIWFVLAAAFAVGEIFTAGFFLLWFGVGAAVAGVLGAVGLGAGWQWASFVVVSLVLVASSRRFADRVSKPETPGIGANRLIGREGIVLESVDPLARTGRIRVDTEEWRAESETGEVLPAGARVSVVRIEGTRAVVRPISEEG